MDKRIVNFIETLKIHLEGLPEKEVQEAVGYYEEYLNDASEAGKDLDQVISELDSPEQIASGIKAEISITKAQHSPGLRNFFSALKSTFKIVSTPFTMLLLSIFIVASFGVVAMFFVASGLCAIAGTAVGAVIIFQAFKIQSKFVLEIIGTLGMGLFGSSICVLLSVCFFQLARFLIKGSAYVIHNILKKPKKPLFQVKEEDTARRTKLIRGMQIILAAMVIGLLVFFASGLPWRYYMIFDSVRPQNVVKKIVGEYDAADINKISIVTAHSRIKILQGDSNKIILSYEKPDWLDYEVANNGSMLSFYEKSNGRLPLFDLVSLHESPTELEISIPMGLDAEIISVESKGGHIVISNVIENISAKTLNGNITLETKGLTESFNLKANTINGKLMVDGNLVGQKVNKGTEYYKNIQAEKTIELVSSNGNVNVKQIRQVK